MVNILSFFVVFQSSLTDFYDHLCCEGGGYIYRLCPASEILNEECFQKTELKWATNTHVLRFSDSAKDKEINATDVTSGGGIGWRLNPLPNVRNDPCDYNVTEHDGPGAHCVRMHCPGCGPPLYAADASCPDICSKHYPGTPDGRTPTLPFPNPVPGIDFHAFAVEDTVEVPDNIPAGEYILGWRWDCEVVCLNKRFCTHVYCAYHERLPAFFTGMEYVRRHYRRLDKPGSFYILDTGSI